VIDRKVEIIIYGMYITSSGRIDRSSLLSFRVCIRN